MPLAIGVTSHRNIPAREEAAVRARIREFFATLQREFPELPLLVLSALAEGGDQWVAEEALAVGARLIAPLPMARSLYAQDFPDAVARARFDALCDKAEIVELSGIDEDTRAQQNVPLYGNERDRRYANAGVYVSAHCHILLAIWDGKESDRLGGTAQIAYYHLTGFKPESLERRRNAAKFNPLGNDNERLLFHIVCSRDAPDGAPAPPLQPLQTFWRVDDLVLPGDQPAPDDFRAMFTHMSQFNADWAKYRGAVDAGASKPSAQDAGMAPAGVSAIDNLFCAADWLAMHFQHRVLFAMRAIYTMAALMGIAFMCYSDLPAQDYMIFVFLALFAFGGWLSVLAQRRGWHRKYLDYRALAEGLRVQSYWRRAGLPVTGDAEFAHDNFLQKQDVELGWIRNVMRSAGLGGDLHSQPASLAEVIAEWVGESGKSGQLYYFERRAAERTRRHNLTETLGKFSLWIGIAISVFLAVFFLQLSQDAKTWLVAAMAIASIVAAVREAYAYRKADKELIKQYRFMCRIFASARSALDRTRDPIEQRDILRVLGETALAEHAEWTLMHRERPLQHARF